MARKIVEVSALQYAMSVLVRDLAYFMQSNEVKQEWQLGMRGDSGFSSEVSFSEGQVGTPTAEAVIHLSGWPSNWFIKCVFQQFSEHTSQWVPQHGEICSCHALTTVPRRVLRIVKFRITNDLREFLKPYSLKFRVVGCEAV